ncbi:MAG: TRAP transporter small permease [Gemmobacter sp.]|jgi:TRAP-type C4-dicarboxylate transport system permease small subunit
MDALARVANLIGGANGALLALGRGIGAACLMLMLAAILAQVWFRYVIGTALAWPEEAARFLMLWSACLMAPTALRSGGFVAIDMLRALLPARLSALIGLALMGLMAAVLVVAVRIGWSEVTGLGGRFATDSLRVPASLDLSHWVKVPRAAMMASMLAGGVMMLVVTLELALRALVSIGGAEGLLAPITTSAPEGQGE